MKILINTAKIIGGIFLFLIVWLVLSAVFMDAAKGFVGVVALWIVTSWLRLGSA